LKISGILVCFYDYYVSLYLYQLEYLVILVCCWHLNSGMPVFIPFFISWMFMYCIYRYNSTQKSIKRL